MASFPGKQYAPPGVYTTTTFDSPVATVLDAIKIPLLIGEGNEFLTQTDLEVVRGSSATLDETASDEDMAGRAVLALSAAGVPTLGAFDGVATKFKVRNLPIVTGSGKGVASNSRDDVTVTIDGLPIVVRSVAGLSGIVELAQAPQPGQVVRCTYFFSRQDLLATDDVSAQVTPGAAIVRASLGIGDSSAPAPDSPVATLEMHDASGQVSANNVLNFIVDGVTQQVVVPAKAAYTMAQIASAISSAKAGTLTATTFFDAFGKTALQLSATGDLTVLAGSANQALGLAEGQSSVRARTFYVFNGPIVDGTNGGITSTDPSHVVVKVDGIQVIPTSLNGSTRAVTLAAAPKSGAKVTIQYHHNTWQDTFDLLGHNGVTEVSRVGDVPGQSTYVQGQGFVLDDDKILWGAASTVKAGLTTAGKTVFGGSQVSAKLVDSQAFLSPCTPVLTVSAGVASTSGTDFNLPLQPTLGNGRDTKLGKSLFQDLSNGRIDLPVHRPDVVTAYWGWDIQDALERGPVAVVKVEGSVLSLATAVPTGAKVWASHFYSRLVDATFTVKAALIGQAGIGTYEVLDAAGANVLGASYTVASKSAGLTGIPINWPSAVEALPDLRHEANPNVSFLGPIAETVTVKFKTKKAAPALLSAPGVGPYTLVHDHSDRLRLLVNGAALASAAAGNDLGLPSNSVPGFAGIVVGSNVVYGGGTGSVVGTSYTLDAVEEINLTVDGVDIKAPVAAGQAKNIDWYVAHINEAANGHQAAASGLAADVSTVKLNIAATDAALASHVTDYYKGWVIVISSNVVGNNAADNISGQVRTITGSVYDGISRVIVTVDAVYAQAIPNNRQYSIYNPTTQAQYVAATRFDGPVALAANKFDKLSFWYQGSATVVSTVLTADLDETQGPFLTVGALVTELQAKITAAIAAEVANNTAELAGLAVQVSANTSNQIVFKIRRPGKDLAGALCFIADATPAKDFAILAGIDAKATNQFTGQAVLVQAPIAKAVNVKDIAAAVIRPYDRLFLRNRLIPGGLGAMAADSVLAQAKIVVQAGTGNVKAGLTTGTIALAGSTATVEPATLFGRVGLSGGQDSVSKQPIVKFYDGTGAHAKNDTFSFTLDGTLVSVKFASTPDGSGAGALLLGPLDTGGSNGSVLDTIRDAIVAAGFGNAAAVVTTKRLIIQEGAGLRLSSARADVQSSIVIGAGLANATLGFVEGQTAARTLVPVNVLASALNADRQTADQQTALLSFTANGGGGNSFVEVALASVVKDAAGGEHLNLQTLLADATAALQWKAATTEDVLLHGTGFDAIADVSSVGDSALGGFAVFSDQTNGSGSVNTSVLNAGVGQDGFVGQTFRDLVTGLAFTVLPRGFQDNPTGPWPLYPDAETFKIVVSKTYTTDANLVRTALPGIELAVTNTTGVGVGDTAIVTTYDRAGAEPAVGDVYYVSYVHQKQDLSTKFFTKVSAIEQAFGPVSADNPLSLAAYLALLNGAVVVACKQVPREVGSGQASLESYKAAITETEGVLPGNVKPDIIIPLRGDSDQLFQVLAKSCDKMSSIRYKSERTALVGLAAGRTPAEVKSLAQLLGNRRIRVVYPDMAIVPVTDFLGNTREALVDGVYVAAALAGSIVNPSVDVATPWTNRRLVGFRQLGRKLDEVEMNQIASVGVTVLVDKPPFIVVRHGLTTDMTDVMSKTPTIIQIADHVQQQTREVLDRFVGVKFLPTILTQIEGRLAMLFKSLVAQQIIVAYVGIKATVSADDPTTAEIVAFYSPVFPLDYLKVSFTVRGSV